MSDTNINLPLKSSLLQDTQDVAQELDVSLPRLIILALQAFIRRYQGQKQLLEKLNAVYADESDVDELEVVQQMRSTHRRMVEDEW